MLPRVSVIKPRRVFFVDRQRINVQHFHQLWVHALPELTIFIEDVCKPPRHAPAPNSPVLPRTQTIPPVMYSQPLSPYSYHGDRTGYAPRNVRPAACGKQATAGRFRRRDRVLPMMLASWLRKG